MKVELLKKQGNDCFNNANSYIRFTKMAKVQDCQGAAQEMVTITVLFV